ncbi:serine acetyltransferase [Pelomyxa schiedti]|nr:serine acetyltransferase [Pelomyxa schiedti]
MSYVWPVPLAPHLDTIVSSDVIASLQRSYELDSADQRFTSLVASAASVSPARIVQQGDGRDPVLREMQSSRVTASSNMGRYVTFPLRITFTELDLLMEIMWPRFYNCCELAVLGNKPLLREKLNHLAGVMFDGIFPYHQDVLSVVGMVVVVFLKLGEIRELLKKDVLAAYQGDPAAASIAEIIRCYPSLAAVMIQRIAHEFYLVKALVYPRELCEMVHRLTAIDLHPGAKIGEYFFIDHGVGTVIGETAEIGSWCRLYQNVTLGALHFEIDESTKTLKKGPYKRHPTVGNHVVIGTGTKLLGPIIIGDNVSIGANSWIQEDIPPNTTVFIREHPAQMKKQKSERRVSASTDTTTNPTRPEPQISPLSPTSSCPLRGS